LQLIAEIKKATPSKGRLVATLEHRAIARTYTIGGAAGISILTESKYFQGSIDHLGECRVSIDGYYPGGRPAMLRKDFIFDPYQVYESRAYGADAILLIVSILTDDELRALVELAHRLKLECLVEVANEEEVERALKADADLIGINNRDLRTFEVDLGVTERLRPLIPMDRTVIALSGVHTRADAERMAKAGAHAVLVGEALMTATDVREKMREFLI
jgi:indole-3-glycerol phosphate synthase